MDPTRATPLPPARSPWLDGAQAPRRSALAGAEDADVAVVGGGITGLTTALLLARAGKRVVVVEADRVGHGVTGHTTAKVTALHGLVYDELSRRLGTEAARAYAAGNQAAFELIAATVEGESIDCDWRAADAYTYAGTADGRSEVERELEAARAAGLPVELVTETPLPYGVQAAIRLAGQAEFHPWRYVDGLARAIERLGGRIYEHTRVHSVSKRPGRPELSTAGGTVSASHIVLATLFPLLDRGIFFTRLTAQRSYGIAATVSKPVGGMFISAETPTRSIRSHPWHDGSELLIVGGEGHITGENSETIERYERLERFAREHFEIGDVAYRWSAHDLMPADGLPYAGPVTPMSRSIWAAAGFRKWGLTNGTLSAIVLADRILGRENPHAELVDTNRLDVLQQARGIAKEAGKDARHMTDWLRFPRRGPESLAPGEGAIVRHRGRPAAGYRDEQGQLHLRSAACTHLGCPVAWNAAERSWDCPCHGSRFSTEGDVLQGPAVRPLHPR